MVPPKKVLIAVTSAHKKFYDDGSKTGLYWSEAVHPFHAFRKAGFEVDFTSETGSFGYDDHSISGPPFISEEDLAEFNDKESESNKALSKVKKTSDIKATDYGIFFAAGGHAALFDFPRARQLQDAAEEIYEAGGIVAAVCHGPAILEGVLDRSTGDFLIKGKKVTGFTDLGEVQLNVKDAIVSNGLVTLEPMFKSAGARYEPPEEPLAAHAVTDRRVVTGANPASAEITAEHAIAAFNETYFE